MKAIVKLAVFLAVIYAAFSYGKPHLDRLFGTLGLGDLGGGGSPQSRCIAVAERTTESFSDLVVRRAQPPVDRSRWSGGYRLAEGRLQDARLACECSGEVCELGRDALDQLATHMQRWDDAVNGGEPMVDGPRSLQRIYSTLGRAKGQL